MITSMTWLHHITSYYWLTTPTAHILTHTLIHIALPAMSAIPAATLSSYLESHSGSNLLALSNLALSNLAHCTGNPQVLCYMFALPVGLNLKVVDHELDQYVTMMMLRNLAGSHDPISDPSIAVVPLVNLIPYLCQYHPPPPPPHQQYSIGLLVWLCITACQLYSCGVRTTTLDYCNGILFNLLKNKIENCKEYKTKQRVC